MKAILEFPVDATSGLEFRVAHHSPVSGCEAIHFPNQGLLPAYIEQYSYIRGNEFIAARLVGPDDDGYYSVEVELRETAAKKINQLAMMPRVTGLGVFKRGEPVQLIQVVHGISGRVLVWHGFENEQEAKVILDIFGSVAAANDT